MRNALSRYVEPGPRTRRPGLLAAMLTAMLAVMLAGAAALAADPGGSSGATTTYRWVDAQGVVHYSDTPQPGAQKLEIAPAQTFQPTPVPTAQTESAPAPAADPYTTCLITQPEAQQSFYAPDSVPVTLQLAPDLRPGDHVQVTYDGQSVAPADDSGVNFQIDMPVRGQHTVAADVMDGSGRTVCTAQAVIFYVRRPSVDSPQSPTAQHPASAPPGR